MKLSIDAAGDMMLLTLQNRPEHHFKRPEQKLIVGYTEEGEIVSLLLLELSSFLGGRRLQELDLDLTPERKDLEIEVPESTLKRVREHMARALNEKVASK
ncbi:MAG: hypothetical protein HYY02_11885 [Chloroflexi bacterium]|nr:hypothetical protein [Chloroflexota bacterium]